MESVFINDRVRDGNGVPVLDPGGGSGTLYTDLLTDTLYVWDGSAWQTVIGGGGGTPGGLNTQVQYNNAGAFGGITGATTDGIALTLVAPVLGTPASGTLTNCTGLPVGAITGLAAGIATWLATPSSANLATAVTDETGTAGNLVFSTAPAFTGPVTLAEAVGSSALAITGATQVLDFPVLTATQTWNAAGTTFRLMKLTVTSTARNVASRILDCLDGTTSCVSVQGNYGTGPALFVGGPVGVAGYMRIDVSGGGRNIVSSGNGFTLNSGDTGLFTFTNSTSIAIGSDANHVFAQRSGTNAQAMRLYNTFTSSTNYERLEFDWITTANTMLIGCQKGSGGGTARVLNLVYGGTTTAAISIPITSGQVTFGGGIVSGGTTMNGANFSEFTEMVAPAAGAANTCRIYAQDNGAGKTQLMALFNSGTAQQIAIEP